MTDLSTRYLGLKLKNPVVVASSSLSGSVEGVKLCAEAGAGAIVLKSLFEEQIAAETGQLSQYADYGPYGEAEEYLQGYGKELGPKQYLDLVKGAKQAVEVPIIASVNCVTDENWSEYARKLENAGADAIELNIALMPTSGSQAGTAVEERYFRILHSVKSQVGIPVTVKLGPYFSAFAHFAQRLCSDRQEGPEFSVGWCGPGESSEKKLTWRGADGLTLFNRFYQLDIDVDQLKLVAGNPFSSPDEIHAALRWISLLAGRIDADLAATTGVHDGRDAAKQILAGAQVVQVCSTLYNNGLAQIGVICKQLQAWMERHNFADLAACRGRLSQARTAEPKGHERLQYIKLFVGMD